jgi:hypothetical protein
MMIFYNAGELTRIALTDSEFAPYSAYGYESGVHTRRPGRKELIAAMDRHWRPFLEGKRRREDALKGLAAAVLRLLLASGNQVIPTIGSGTQR